MAVYCKFSLMYPRWLVRLLGNRFGWNYCFRRENKYEILHVIPFSAPAAGPVQAVTQLCQAGDRA